MPIVDVKNIPSTIFDQLLVVNDLVQTLRETDNLNEIVSTLRTERDAVKKQYDDLATLKAADDQTAKDLTAATAANNLSIAAAQDERKQADQAKANADAATNKALAAQKTLVQAQTDFDAKTAASNTDLDKRTKMVSEREVVATKAQNDADAMKSDYQDKLDNLKKLTGG